MMLLILLLGLWNCLVSVERLPGMSRLSLIGFMKVLGSALLVEEALRGFRLLIIQDTMCISRLMSIGLLCLGRGIRGVNVIRMD